MLYDTPPPLSKQADEAKLPQELVDLVIGDLRDDIATLKQCSLVAKSWLHTTSSFLLRRVLWPPCANRDSSCARGPSCEYTVLLKNSFALCAEALSSSPRLQDFVRELVCVAPHGGPGMMNDVHSALELATFVNILDSLPHLEVVDLQGVMLRAGSSPSSTRTGHTLKKLSVSSDGDPRWLWDLFPFLSTFRRVHHLALTVYHVFPHSDSSEPPESKLEVDILELDQLQDPPGNSDPSSFCAGLIHHLDLQTLRRFATDTLDPSFARIISGAPFLESLGLQASGRGELLVYDRIPPHLSSVDISCTFPIYQRSTRSPSADVSWTRIWNTLRAATALPIREILVDASIIFLPRAASSHEALYDHYEAMVAEITDWETPIGVLNGFGRLEKIAFEIRFSIWLGGPIYHPLQVHERHVLAMRDVIAKGLPRKYVDMLHVRAVDSN